MDQKQQIAKKLKETSNILVTVSKNPSVDQLASCIGLTLALNKMGKHTTAVFSGKTPSTIEFLQPEKTFENSIDSLRDFIISLDKAKADKLRYKVEDNIVKIFITPYHTTISEKDLTFSQGDFNIDAVIALGVHAQADIDQAITAHGRILHDATVITINVKPGGELGGMNWLETGASSLCELAVELVDILDKQVVDSQIATAFLTGIVAETERFSNSKTAPATMSISAELMAAGANQQLVVTKLDQGGGLEPSKSAAAKPNTPGMLEIPHVDQDKSQTAQPPAAAAVAVAPAPQPLQSQPPVSQPFAPQLAPATPMDNSNPGRQIDIDDQGVLHSVQQSEFASKSPATTDPTKHMGGSRMILEPPTMGGQMSATLSPGENYSQGYSMPRSSQPPLSPIGPGSYLQPSQPSVGYPPAPGPNPYVQASYGAFPSGGPTPFVTSPSTLAQPQVGGWQPPPPPMQQPMPGPMSQVSSNHIDNARNAVLQAISSQPAQPDHPSAGPPTNFDASQQTMLPPLPNTPPPPVPPPITPL